MYAAKLIVLGLLLGCVGDAYAWDAETPPTGNETMNTGFNPFMNASYAETPFEYSYEREIMNMPFTQGSYTSNDAITICTNYKIYKQIWDGSSYIQVDECNISIDTCINLNYDANKNQWVLPENYEDVMTNGFLVKRYFQELINSDSQYCSNYNNSDKIDNPDVLYTVVTVDTGDGETHYASMYTSIDDRSEMELSSSDIDYGYGTGRGADAGTGGIYEGLNIYGTGEGDVSCMGSAFNIIFWMIIPLLFILCIMKLIGKII